MRFWVLVPLGVKCGFQASRSIECHFSLPTFIFFPSSFYLSLQGRRSGPKSGGGGGGGGQRLRVGMNAEGREWEVCSTKSTRVRQLIVKQTGCLPFEQVAPKCLPFPQDTTKQRKATMGIFGLYERSHIKRY